ncbi:ABC transporter ATP-binding protein [Aggregatibacter actinomycetemcomitans]|nr:ABC transporter ATP-binding protein [Aggregatibacter actinomycetemcomitans]
MLLIEEMTVRRGQGSQQFNVRLPKLALQDGEILAIQGASGCGKSTLLEMIGLILQPDSLKTYQLGDAGQVMDLQPFILQKNQTALSQLRAAKLGFMLQTGGLLPFLTVQQNITLPCEMLNKPLDKAWFLYLTESLNLSSLLSKYPRQLSIGERQRVSFIRSVIHKPCLLLADEPTAALDPNNAQTLFSLMIKLVEEQKITALLVTHDWDLVENNRLPSLYADLSAPAQAVFLPKESDHATG